MRASRRGMTLVESMVAISILLIMSIMIAQTIASAIEFNRLLSQRDETTRGARVALATIHRAVQLAYLTPNVQGVERYETVFVGMDQDPDQLFLSTLAHDRLYMDSRESDQAEISIFAEDSPPEVGQGQVLYIRESGLVDEEPAEGGKVLPLAYNVRSFNLRYLDQISGEWRDEWDTRQAETMYRLPRAVEIALVLMAPDPEDPEQTVDVPFLSTVQLHYADNMQNAQTMLARQMIDQANAGVPGAGGGGVPPGSGGMGGIPAGGFGGGSLLNGMGGAVKNGCVGQNGLCQGGTVAGTPAGGGAVGQPANAGRPGRGGVRGGPGGSAPMGGVGGSTGAGGGLPRPPGGGR